MGDKAPYQFNVPVGVIGAQPPAVGKASLIVVYRQSGNRSAAARQILMDLGYTNVVDFGAVSKWTDALILGREPGAAPK